MKLRLLQLSLVVCLVIIVSCSRVMTSSITPTLTPLTETLQLPSSTTQMDTISTSPVPSSPTLSPSEEELIVFAERSEQVTTIGLINGIGQNRQDLTGFGGNDFLPKWSPDGQSIAYLSDRQVPLDKNNEQFYDLWLLNLANEHSIRLTHKGRVFNYLTAFVWSPNSDKIMYSAPRGVETVELKSGSIDIVGDYFGPPFAWSQKNEIAITDSFTEPMAIFSLAILDSNYVSHLPHYPGFTAGGQYGLNTATSLVWRPDGEQLAIGSYFAGKGDSDLKIVAVVKDEVVDQASLAERFKIIQESEVTDVAWSPDGTRLAFRLIKEDNERIYVTNSKLTELLALTPADKLCNYPQWSPDSTRLVFSCRIKDDNSDLWLVKADGSDLHPLTNTPTISEETPMWQPLSQ